LCRLIHYKFVILLLDEINTCLNSLSV